MKLQPKYLLALSIWPVLLCAEPENNTHNPWAMCVENNVSATKYTTPEPFPELKKDETRISAQQIENAPDNIAIFTGDVLIEREQLRLRADKVLFNRDKQKLDISGNIHIDSQSISIDGDSGWFDLINSNGEFENSHYFSPKSHLQGSTPN